MMKMSTDELHTVIAALVSVGFDQTEASTVACENAHFAGAVTMTEISALPYGTIERHPYVSPMEYLTRPGWQLYFSATDYLEGR